MIKKERIFYNQNNQKEILKGFDYYKNGGCAIVYKKDDELLKIYKSDCKYMYCLSKKMFNIFQRLNLDNVVTLLNYYYYDLSKLNYITPCDAYSMKYIEPSNIDLYTVSKEYILNTINKLEKTAYNLSINKILIHDVHNSNIIFNNEGATLIDIDTYRLNNLLSRKKIILDNQRQILYFLKSKLYDDYKSHNEEIDFYKIERLFSFDLNKNSICDEIDRLYNRENLLESLKAKN